MRLLHAFAHNRVWNNFNAVRCKHCQITLDFFHSQCRLHFVDHDLSHDLHRGETKRDQDSFQQSMRVKFEHFSFWHFIYSPGEIQHFDFQLFHGLRYFRSECVILPVFHTNCNECVYRPKWWKDRKRTSNDKMFHNHQPFDSDITFGHQATNFWTRIHQLLAANRHHQCPCCPFDQMPLEWRHRGTRKQIRNRPIGGRLRLHWKSPWLL